jgi:predicted RNA-binding Zn ribbon-like protein
MTMPSWVPGEETKPAPMPLLLIQAFVNTWDGDHGSDLLLDPASGRDWLARAGLWSAERTPEPAELHLARTVREGIRAILIANSGGPGPAPGELRPLRDVAEDGQVVLGVGPGGQLSLSTSPAELPGPDLLALLLVIRDAQRDGTWLRLKACGNPDCRWAFYDRSHSRVGAWCNMASCGNRIKNRRLRERQQ